LKFKLRLNVAKCPDM